MEWVNHDNSQVFRSLQGSEGPYHRVEPLHPISDLNSEIVLSFVSALAFGCIVFGTSETNTIIMPFVPSRLVLTCRLILRMLTWHVAKRDAEASKYRRVELGKKDKVLLQNSHSEMVHVTSPSLLGRAQMWAKCVRDKQAVRPRAAVVF